MLIAPIFHNNYLTTKQPDQPKPSTVSQNNNNNVTPEESSPSSSRYNFFKTALDRGTALIKSTLFSKNSNNYSANDSNSEPKPSSVITVSSATTKHSEKYDDDDFDDESSSSSESESEHSSPDSIKTELMFFKPISREPRTQSSMTSSSKILRIPSIRSTSSASTDILSPCPSPFFIPITPQRQSAFSFVSIKSTLTSTVNGKATKAMTTITSPQRPKNNSKRKNVKSSPDKCSTEQSSSKRRKYENVQKTKTAVAVAAAIDPKANARTTKTRQQKTDYKQSKTDLKKKTELLSKETRGRKRKNTQEDSTNITTTTKAVVSPQKKRKPTINKNVQKEFKSPLKVNGKKCDSKKLVIDFKRVTRSQSMKDLSG